MARFPIRYDKASKPARGPQPGAKALMQWALANYRTAGNLGIYNNRSVRGGKSLSTHAEGRAADIGFPYTKGGTKEGWHLANRLVEHSADLGVQCVIYSRKIWSSPKAAQGWRPYKGKAAHYEHIHVELTREAGKALTSSMIRETMGGSGSKPTGGDPVSKAQRILADAGHYRLKIDGDFGNGSLQAVADLATEAAALRAQVKTLQANGGKGGGMSPEAAAKVSAFDQIVAGLRVGL